MNKRDAQAILEQLKNEATAAAREDPRRPIFERQARHVFDPDTLPYPHRFLTVQHRFDTRTEKLLTFNPSAVTWEPKGAFYVVVLTWDNETRSISQQEATAFLATGELPVGFGDMAPEDDSDPFEGLGGWREPANPTRAPQGEPREYYTNVKW